MISHPLGQVDARNLSSDEDTVLHCAARNGMQRTIEALCLMGSIILAARPFCYAVYRIYTGSAAARCGLRCDECMGVHSTARCCKSRTGELPLPAYAPSTQWMVLT